MRLGLLGLLLGFGPVIAVGACGDDSSETSAPPLETLCEPGSVESCFTGPADRLDVGACRSGTRICESHGRFWGPCKDEVLPVPETCGDAIDDNCDGVLSCGDTVFARRFGAASEEAAVAVDVATDGGLVVIGTYRESFALATPLPMSTDSRDVFVSKHAADTGVPEWSVGITGGTNFTARGIAIGPAGEIAAIASVAGTANIQGGPVLSGPGGGDVLVVMLGPDGSYRWSKHWGDADEQHPIAVAFGPDGDLVVAGIFRGTIDFGLGPLAQSSSPEYDVFVAKLAGDGSLRFARALPGSDDNVVRAVAIGTDGAIHLAGDFKGTLDFGAGPIASKGDDDVFVAVLEPTGLTRWAASFGDEAQQRAFGVAVAAEGRTVVAGRFEGTIVFGAESFTAVGGNLFAAELDASGTVRWARSLEGAANAGAYDVAVDARGRVLVSGFYEGQPTLMGSALPESGAREPNILVAKLEPDGARVWARGVRVHGEQATGGSSRGWRKLAPGPGDRIALVGFVRGEIDLGDEPLVDQGGSDILMALLEP